MKLAAWGTVAVLVALVAAVVGVWTLQNADQVVQFRLDMGSMIGAWQMEEAVPASWVALGAFVAGLVVAALPLSIKVGAQKRRVKALQRQIAFTADV